MSPANEEWDALLSLFIPSAAHLPTNNIGLLHKTINSLRTLLDQTSSYIFTKDTDGRYTFVNKKVQELFGIPIENIIGYDDQHFFDLALANELQLNDRYVITFGETIEREETNIIKATGETRVYWSIKTPLRNPQGQIIGLCGISTDITDRKQMEAALRQSEAKFRTFYDSTSSAVMLLDEHGFLDCNPAALDLFGCASKQQFCTYFIIDISPPQQPCGSDSSQLANKHIAVAMQEGNCRFEWLYKRLDNQATFAAEVQLCAIKFDGKTILQASIHDISERKQAKSKLLESLSLLRATLDSTNDAILVVDLNNKWVMHNQQFIDLWEIPKALVAAKDDTAALQHALTQLTDPAAFLNKVYELYAAPEATSYDVLHFNNGKIVERISIPQRLGNKVVGRVWSFRDITLHELTGAALKRQSEKYLALLRNASDGIHILDYDGNIIEVSDSFCAMLGYRWEEMIGMNVFEWDANSPPRDLVALVRQQFEKPVRSQFETRHKRKDGSVFDVEISGFPLELDGKPVLFNSSRDISARKQAEKRLLDSENKYRLLIESAKDAIFLADTVTGIIIDCNKSAAALLGRPKQEIIGLHQSAIHPTADISFYKQLFKNHVETGNAISDDVCVINKDGQIIPVDVTASVFELNGRTVMLGIFRNISDRKHAETELRIAATAFESQEGILITDANNIILRVNKAFTDITGYAPQDVIGKTPQLLKSFRHNPDFYAAMWHSINTTGLWEGEIWNRRKDGEIYPESLTITAVKAPNGSITNYVATLTDITERKAADQEIQYLAFYDPLTELPNRRLLLDRLKQAILACIRSGQKGALLFLDLDHFKILNDTLGHDVGDLLLQQVAQRLTNCVRE